jgi:hypothetical protein
VLTLRIGAVAYVRTRSDSEEIIAKMLDFADKQTDGCNDANTT